MLLEKTACPPFLYFFLTWFAKHVSIAGVDLVVHTAGPFQQAEKCNVLEAAINTKVIFMHNFIISIEDNITY